jgi:hypothetical protein
MPPPEGRGKTFSSKKGKVAPDALKEALAPVRQNIKPTAVVAKEMFAVKGKNTKNVAKPAAKPVVAAKPVAPAKPLVAEKPLVAAKPVATPLIVAKPLESKEETKEEAKEEAKEEEDEAEEAELAALKESRDKAESDLASLLEAQEAAPTITSDLERLPAEQKEMAILIQKEESRDLYNTQIPAAYVPQTRRGFSDFIKLQYKPYILPAGPIPE